MRGIRTTGLWLLMMLAAAATAPAQVIHGRITDGVTGKAVASAGVLVLNPDSTLRTLGLTDGEGRFLIHSDAGRFILRVERQGYATVWSTPLEMEPSDTLDFAIRLPPDPVQLEALAVVAKADDPSGFIDRRRSGMGRYMGPEEIERRPPTEVADLLAHIPGFYMFPGNGARMLLRVEGRGRHCTPTVYLDGHLVVKGTATPGGFMTKRNPREGVSLDSVVNARLIRAVEIYQSGAYAPAQFHPAAGVGGGGDCAVIVLWTYVGFGS